jgi:ribosomal-protein-alanine N-acetyltransferase
MKGIEIQQMHPSHLPAVLAIEQEVFPAPWSEGMFRQELSGNVASRMRVALLENRVIAYYIAWFLEDMVHLINIAVARRYQHRGIGTVLLERILGEAGREGRRYIALEVRESNTAAQQFYEKFNFEKIGIRKKYYSDNHEDAVLMLLDLEKHPSRGEKGGDVKR